jgi:3-keto-L-gulonate-6-phosphate decarboxylase
MKLQISFDDLVLEKNIAMAQQVVHYCDVLVIGTLPLFKYGITILERFRKEFPDKTIFTDSKIVNKGRDAAALFSLAGTDWISVIAGTNREVIHGACSKAHDLGKKVILDFFNAGTPGQETLEAKSLGADAILLHQPADSKDDLMFFEQWEMVKGNTTLPIIISTKRDREHLQQLCTFKPDGIIVSKSITDAFDPAIEAQFFYNQCK